MEAWREVARRIAHEIKNPLTPIQLSAQRLRKRYAADLPGSVLDDCTRTIIAEVEVLKNLVSEFAHFARLPAGPHLPTDLNALVDDALVLFREAHRGVRFRFERDPKLPPLDLDRDGIRRVLTNILDNAVAALPTAATVDGDGADGGSVSGEGSRARGNVEVLTRFDATRGVVSLEIADDGMGMTPEVKARLFEPYFSTKPHGTGLGLAIASAVLADHQAFIRVRDNQPRGSRFLIELPVRERKLEVPERASA
jgi:two-component system nitrogen regulation sensor histidine kinase NtrY